jgi:eukaryotic-like serine/threonine-protein kinase
MIYSRRKRLSIFLFLLCVNICAVLAQPQMFRGTPDHKSSFTTNANIVFGEPSWEFNTGAPIRSTVVCDKHNLYVGSSENVLYALDKRSGAIKWKFNSGYAIESSPALYNNAVFFSNNKQTLYSLNAETGKVNWELDFGKTLAYDWGFDYYYSSPTIVGNKILIGIKDGFVYDINANDGKIVWKFKTEGIVRSTPAVSGGTVFFGDTNGILYATTLADGKEIWRFKTIGNNLKNEDFGFDRRAIISSPVAASGKIIFGCRDGFFYAVNEESGKELWHVDHHVSWVISSLSVQDSIAVTGTSDGKFVQAVNINTGKEIWKFKTVSIVWSSPVIHNNKVYIGSQEGVLYTLNLADGSKVTSFQASGKIFSSLVISDSLLYFGTDKGYLYALKPVRFTYREPAGIKRYVYWEKDADVWFHYGNDTKIKTYLNVNNYTTIDSKKLADVLANTDSAARSVVVFASNYFPPEIYACYNKSLLRQYLDNGGRMVVLGNNPVIYKFDREGNVTGFNFSMADSVLNIKYGPGDLRSMGGVQPAFPTEDGKRRGLTEAYTSFLPLDEKQVDIVLGKDENGMASAWIKKFSSIHSSGFIQIWMDPDFVDDMSSIVKVAEYGME